MRLVLDRFIIAEARGLGTCTRDARVTGADASIQSPSEKDAQAGCEFESGCMRFVEPRPADNDRDEGFDEG